MHNSGGSHAVFVTSSWTWLLMIAVWLFKSLGLQSLIADQPLKSFCNGCPYSMSYGTGFPLIIDDDITIEGT